MPTKANNLTPEEYRRKWGIPDWRDEAAYPAELPDELWRWEFLRRREGYRRDWEREYSKTVRWYSEHSFQEWIGGKALDAPALESPGPFEPGNFDCDPQSEEFIVWMKGGMQKYRMQRLINPAIARPRNLDFHSVHLIDSGDCVFGPLALVLDPNASLETHIETLKQGLDALRAKNGDRRNRRAEWASYLRALDGKACGATNKDIWEVVSGDYANNPYARGRDLVRAAENLRDKHPA